MSKFSKTSKKSVSEHRKYKPTSVENFVGGTSYTLNPLDSLRIVAASSIFGEPSYYRGSHDTISNLSRIKGGVLDFTDFTDVETTTDLFTKTIDQSLDYDFKGTLELAVRLRHEFLMRLNPSVIFVRASLHPNRVKFNEENPGLMRKFGKQLIVRPDDITNQFDYYMWLKVTKNGLPSIVKRVWSDSLSEFTKYQINKYKSKSLIDLVRISHATSDNITELIKTGGVTVGESEQTWESLHSKGKTWLEIVNTIQMPHMSLLRNLRNIFTEISDVELTKTILSGLISGVVKGKQFPYRYYTAYQMIERSESIYNKQLILEALDECVIESINNTPKLKGKTVCLSDNSGSAWGSLPSEYGTLTVAEIGNLSSMITSLQSEDGEVGVFGDRLALTKVSREKSILSQLTELSKLGQSQGGGTEHGIWIFFSEAIKNKTHYDNIFVFSDQQAGHSKLYGVSGIPKKDLANGSYIDVLKMIQEYRRLVNPKVNVFSVQTAGYNNSVIPENLYRTSILSGWTGKESVYAKEISEIWDTIEDRVVVEVMEEQVI